MITAPYMAMMRLDFISSDTPVECLGAESPSNSLVELTVYRAGFDMDTRLPVQQEEILRLRMTDEQYSTFLIRPAFNDGYVCTLRHLAEHQVEPYEPARDPSKRALHDAINEAIRPDGQCEEFFERAADTLREAQEAGRLLAGTKREITSTLSCIVNNLAVNERGSQETAHNVGLARTRAAINNLRNHLIYMPHGTTSPALPDMDGEALPEVGCAAMLYGGHTTSMHNLFSDQVHSNGCMSLTVSAASRLGSGNRLRYQAEKQYLAVDISPASYARLLQGRMATVPVTIRRFMRKPTAAVPIEHTQEFQPPTPSEASYAARDMLYTALNDAIAIIAGASTSKKALAMAEVALADAKSAFQRYCEQTAAEKQQNVTNSLESLQAQAQAQLEQDLTALPPGEQDAAREKVYGMLRKLISPPR